MLRVVRCQDCGHLSDVRACFCVSCEQDLRLVSGEKIDLDRGEVRALSPEEYVEAAYSSEHWGSSLVRSRALSQHGGEVPIGIVAIVAGIVVAFTSGDWWLLLMIAWDGTTLGYVGVIGATVAFDYLDIRWLRLGQADRAWFVILLSVGPALALLVAVLVLDRWGPLVDYPYRIVLVAPLSLAAWAIREHYSSDERQQPPYE